MKDFHNFRSVYKNNNVPVEVESGVVVELDELEHLLCVFVGANDRGLHPETTKEHLENQIGHRAGRSGVGAVVFERGGHLQLQL